MVVSKLSLAIFTALLLAGCKPVPMSAHVASLNNGCEMVLGIGPGEKRTAQLQNVDRQSFLSSPIFTDLQVGHSSNAQCANYYVLQKNEPFATLPGFSKSAEVEIASLKLLIDGVYVAYLEGSAPSSTYVTTIPRHGPFWALIIPDTQGFKVLPGLESELSIAFAEAYRDYLNIEVADPSENNPFAAVGLEEQRRAQVDGLREGDIDWNVPALTVLAEVVRSGRFDTLLLNYRFTN